MIIEGLMNMGLWVFEALLDILDVLPNLPGTVISSVDSFFNLVLSNLDLLYFVFPCVDYALSLLGIVFILSNWRRLYHMIMWVWHKVPISSD